MCRIIDFFCFRNCNVCRHRLRFSSILHGNVPAITPRWFILKLPNMQTCPWTILPFSYPQSANIKNLGNFMQSLTDRPKFLTNNANPPAPEAIGRSPTASVNYKTAAVASRKKLIISRFLSVIQIDSHWLRTFSRCASIDAKYLSNSAWADPAESSEVS